MDILNEEQGILVAQQSLNELRVFLYESETLGSQQVTATGDKDFALRAQLEDLNDLYQTVVDARFARSLVEDENERMMMANGNGNGGMELMRSIVTTVRGIMASESYIGDGYSSDDDLGDVDEDDVDDSSIPRAGPSSVNTIRVGYVLQGAQYLHDLMGFGGNTIDNIPKTPAPTCAACFDESMTLTGRFEAPCGHLYCPRCIRQLVSTYVSQATPKDIFRCCPGKEPIPVQTVRRFINPKTLHMLQRRIEEASTPMKERIYCPQTQCRRFIDPVRVTARARDSGKLICPSTRCRVLICLRCKEVTHPGSTCDESSDSKNATQIRRQFGWGQCPRCKFVVEKIEGCNSMSCRCGAGFTYTSGIN